MTNIIDADESKIGQLADWSDIELGSAVAAYLSMLHDELAGKPYVKAQVNRKLRDGALHRRTKASIEFRMQNISATLVDLGIRHIAGYLPAKNVGSSVKERIRIALEQNGLALLPFTPTADPKTLDYKVKILLDGPLAEPHIGTVKPRKIQAAISTFVRDPLVKAWVLRVAKGVCEGCKSPAPFIDSDGSPFLEVHHVRPLADDGTDQISNAVALCPNCHRRCHFGKDRSAFTKLLFASNPRLVPELDIGDDALAFEFLNEKI